MFKMSNITQTGGNPFARVLEESVSAADIGDDESDADDTIDDVMDEIRIPEVGDSVVCRYDGTLYYTAKAKVVKYKVVKYNIHKYIIYCIYLVYTVYNILLLNI